MRQKIVAGNWKMNTTINEAKALINAVIAQISNDKHTLQIIFGVPFPYLMNALLLTENKPNIAIAAQNCSFYEKGAYTGEVSVEMLSSIGIKYCIIGHSERRTIFNETTENIKTKVKLLLTYTIKPIWCCGEKLEQRNEGNHFKIIEQQLSAELFELSKEEIKNIIIAYEPVWAIGTGITATSAQAQEMHQYIRTKLNEKYDTAVAQNVAILYGGSCNATNAHELFALPDVDGGLIGGASLTATSFVKIIQSF